MPVITNFGDVVTTGNTLLQGNLTVLNTSTTLSGNLLPNVSGSSNLGQSTAQFGSAYVRTINALSLNVTTQANISSLNVSGTAYFANSNLAISNVTTANVSTANVGTLNVSSFASFTFANTVTANITTANVSTSNTSFLNVSGTAFLSNANVLTANVTAANIATANLTTLNVSGTAFLSNSNTLTANITSLNVSSQANVTSLNVSGTAFLSNANVLTGNVTFANVSTGNVVSLNVSGTAFLSNANVLTGNVTFANLSTANVTSLNVSGTAFLSNANVLTGNVTSLNVSTQANVTSLNVSGTAFLSNANVLTANITSANVITENVTSLNVSGTAFLSNANVLTANITTGNIVSLNVTGDANIANLTVRSNLYTSNIIMSSNLSTNTGFGNVYLTGNLVVNGNIFSSGGSVGSGSGASQGILFTYAASNTLPGAFSTGVVGTSVNGYHMNLSGFSAEAAQAVTQFTYNTGMLKFTTAGLYQVTCVFTGDQPAVKVAIGKTSSATFPPSGTGTTGYDYVYNYPVGSSPSHVVTLPITVTDITQYYYIDVFFSTAAGTPSVLYPTRSTTATGYNFGTYIQVAPFGNYLTSATGVASALLANCTSSSNLSGVYSSNAYRVTLTSANGWTVNGTSTSLAVTANGNFQVNQTGIYEVNLCLNTSGNTPVQFQVGSLANDSLIPNSTAAQYLYSYAPMYTQDPTTTIQLPLNITNVSNVYFIECSFPGTVTGNVALSATSTFVSIKPIGGFINTGTNPWTQQGTSVYYNGGPVGLGVVPTALTETFTVSGNTSFVGNVTVTSDASSNSYVSAKRTPAGSLAVSNYVTGSVPLTTTTNLIQGYLSNVSMGTQDSNVVVVFPSSLISNVYLGPYHSVVTNLATSNLFLETWIYWTGTGDVVSQGGAFPDWVLTVNGKMTFSVAGLGSFNASSTTNFAAGWWHLAVSFVASTKTKYYFLNGTLDGTQAGSGTAGYTSTAPIYIGRSLGGAIRDIRVMKGSIVPVTTFVGGVQSAPFTTAPTYVTGMSTGYTSNLALALNSQYFPGASTSPYGPCLTLPGTVGSYYSQSAGTHSDWKGSGGFTLEAWVNYASLASANALVTGASQMYTIVNGQPTSTGNTWTFGATTTGALAFGWRTSTSTASMNAFVTSNTLTTGSWNHILVQSNASNVYMAINGNFTTLTAQGFTPTGGNTTIAPTIAPSTSNTAASELSYPITVGQFNSLTGPNVSVARARLIYGANVYSSGSFTPNPNFASSATAPFWQLESQFPLPSYPSIQDVTQLSAQTTAYGSLPTPVGGVTSNVLGPYSSYSTLDSIRFDGTGYIDYGNAASSALTTNLWANAWTIEGWVYPTATSTGFIASRSTTSFTTTDYGLYVQNSGGAAVQPIFTNGPGNYYNTSSITCPLNTWTHVAVTYDGARSNIYVGGLVGNSMSMSTFSFGYTPSCNFQIGSWLPSPTQSFVGNLADLRVSNVARYTGSSYTVPTAPFTTDSNTLLLLKSLAQQPGTTLEVQGRGLNAVSLGATRSVQAYPPAPMSSYLLDTTSNSLVTYGQGKYVASASSEFDTSGSFSAWKAFNKNSSGSTNYSCPTGLYSTSSPYAYTGSVRTVDALGNSYAGEWIQIQLPVSVVLSTYTLLEYASNQALTVFSILGSRDGVNWNLVDARSGVTTWAGTPASLTFTVSTTQAYTYFRLVAQNNNGLAYFNACQWTLNGTEEGICVTNDSKVGVGIANPQRALEVAGDLVVSGTISGGAGMGSFRNRIINGDMRIAQRGTSAAGGAFSYLIDRWFWEGVGSSGVTISQESLTSSDAPYQVGFRNSLKGTITIPFPGSVPTYGQKVEGLMISDFNWGTPFGSPATLSFWFRTNTGAGNFISAIIRNDAVTYSWVDHFKVVANSTWQYVVLTIPPPPNGSSWNLGTNSSAFSLQIARYLQGFTVDTPGWAAGNKVMVTGDFSIGTAAGNYIEITGVQLEKGTVATPFEFRPYATELALCQRYFYLASSANGGNYMPYGPAWAASATGAYLTVQHPVTMRAAPTTFSNSALLTFQTAAVAGGSISPTSIALQNGGTSASTVNFAVSGGLTAGQGLVLQSNNTTTSFLGFGAEL